MSEQEPQNIDPFIEFSIPKTINELNQDIEKTLSNTGSGTWIAVFRNKLTSLVGAIDFAQLNGFLDEKNYTEIKACFDKLSSEAASIKMINDLEKPVLLNNFINIVNLYNEKKNEK